MFPSGVKQLRNEMRFSVSAAWLAQHSLALPQNGCCAVCVWRGWLWWLRAVGGHWAGEHSFIHWWHTMSWHCCRCRANCVFLWHTKQQLNCGMRICKLKMWETNRISWLLSQYVHFRHVHAQAGRHTLSSTYNLALCFYTQLRILPRGNLGIPWDRNWISIDPGRAKGCSRNLDYCTIQGPCCQEDTETCLPSYLKSSKGA